MNLKKGAMFGLDARIALAIFGALSVISGAALYNAIEEAKATAIITELNELGKAWEAYYLDTRTSLPELDSNKSNSGFHVIKTQPLNINLGVNGWNGPYTSYKEGASYLISSRAEDVWLMTLTTDVDWSNTANGLCTTGRNCFIWARMYKSPTVLDEYWKEAIDEKVDDSDGADKGDFRWDATGINLKYAAIPNPVD